jgi:CBS domain-containing protein
MQIRDIMTQFVECVGEEDTLETAASKMKDLDVGALPVCGSDGKLAGMITDRDITVRATAAGFNPNDFTVREVMTPDIIYAFEDQDVAEAARIMETKQVRRLPVLNRDKRLVGIVSLGDLATQSPSDALTGGTLAGVSDPSHPNA